MTDATGNTSAASAPFNFTLDRAAPSAPTALDLLAASDSGTSSTDDTTSDTTPTITGAPVEPGATVTLYDSDGTTVIGTTVADGSGNWSITSSALADGVHNFTVKQTDQAGNQGPASAVLPVTIDTTAPAAPIAPDMTAGTDSGTNSGDDSTNDTTPTFTVAAPAAGEIPKLYVDGVLVPSTFDSLTNTLTPTNPLPDGAHSITTTITDAAGNESPQSPSLAISIDTTAPSAPTVTAVPENSNGGVNAAEASDGSIIQVAIPADAKAGDVLTLTIGSGPSTQTVTYTVLAGDVGSTANVPVDAPTLAALPEGSIPVTATLTDATGNTSAPSAAFTFLIDRVAPIAPSIASVPENAGGGINANEGADGTTVNITLPSGTKAGDTITLNVGGMAVSYVVTAGDVLGGSSTVPVSAAILASAVAPTGEGPVSLTATVTDAAGNTGPTSAPFSIDVDLSGPGAPQITDVPDNSMGGISVAEAADGSIVNVDIGGIGAKVGDVITLDWGGTPVTYTLTATDISNNSAPVAVSNAVINTRGSGTFDLTTTLTDSAGNVSPPSTPFTVKVDVVLPFAPTITAISESADGGINAAEAADGTPVTVSLVGTEAEAGDKVVLNWGGEIIEHDLTPAEVLAGEVIITISNAAITAAGDGTIPVVVASINDAAGNPGPASVPFTVVVDTAPLGAPVIAAIPESSGGIGKSEASDGTVVNITLPSGTVVGDTVTLNFGGQIISYTVLAGDADSGSAPIFVSNAILETIAGDPNGTANNVPVSATVTDQAGNVSAASTNFPVNIDFTDPAVPGVLDLTDASDTGSSNTDNITSDTTPTISGAPVEPGAIVTLYDSDGTTVLGTTVADGSGNWSITPSSVLSSGVHNFTTKQTDTAGNQGPASAPLAVTIVTGAPIPGTPDLTTATDSGVSSGDNLTNDPTPDFSVSGVDGNTISVFADVNNDGLFDAGDIALGSAVVAGGVATITAAPDMLDGPYVIRATQTDLGGNVSAASSPLAITIDTVVPSTATPALDLITADDSGSSSTDNRTNKTAYTINATGLEPGATVELKEGATVIATAIVSAGGTASFSLTGATEGAHNYVVAQTDAAGNVSTTGTLLTVTVDVTAPAAPTADLVATSDTGSSNTDNITSDTTPTISGAPVEPGAIVTLYDSDGTTVLGTTVADGSGNWSITPSSVLSSGVHTFTTKQTDTAGNQGPASAPLAVTIVTGAPIPGTPDLTTATDSGVSSGDNLTNDPTPDFSVSGVDGNTISVFADVNNDGLFDAGDIALGSAVVAGGVATITAAPDLLDGPYVIRATQTDLGGNVSAASSPLAITIDTVVPSTATPALDLITADDSGSSSTDNRTNKTAYTINATGLEPGATVELKEGATVIATAIVSAGGTASFSLTGATEGAHNYVVAQTDAAGNVSTTGTLLTVTVDVTAPAAPTADLVATSDTGSSNTDNITSDTTPTISGAPVEPGAIVTLYDSDGTTVLGTTVADGSGNWSITPSSVLSSGVHTFTTKQTDTAGNQGPASAPLAVNIDTNPPVAPTVNSRTLSDTTPVLTGTTATGAALNAGEVLTVTVSGATYAVTPNASGQWSLDLGSAVPISGSLTPLTATNTYSVVARVTDAAGNFATDSTTNELSIIPLVLSNEVVAATEDIPRTGNVLTNDLGGVLSVTQFVIATVGTFAAGTTASITGVGQFTMFSDGAYAFVPTDNYAGTIPGVTYTVSDTSQSQFTTLALGPSSAINDALNILVPREQFHTNLTNTRVFSTANGNAISVSDADSGTSNISVSLSVTNGTLDVAGAGAQASFGGVTITGDTSANVTLTGTAANINTLLGSGSALTYTATSANAGATLTINANDAGNTGTGGASTDVDRVLITTDKDSDADGILNFVDLDDDNDGILDTVEDTVPSLPVGAAVDATQVGSVAFAKGNYVQVGLTDQGSFGASAAGLPGGYVTPRSGTTLGFIADTGRDGFAGGDYIGDFFTPGTDEESFGITVNGVSSNNGTFDHTDGSGPLEQIAGSVTGVSETSTGNIFWSGSVSGLTVDRVVTVSENGLYIRLEATLTNTTGLAKTNIFFMESVDPDNNQYVHVQFPTLNTIRSQGDTSVDNLALVTAEQTNTGAGASGGTEETGSTLALMAFDARAHVTYGGFANRSAADIWNGVSTPIPPLFGGGTAALTKTVGSSAVVDAAISLSFNVGTLNAGASTTLTYFYFLGADPLNAAGSPFQDSDQDNIPDSIDVDSDNDGVSDLIESGIIGASAFDTGTSVGVARDGRYDGPVNGSGIAAAANGGTGVAPRNTNGGPLADYIDLDSDGDGIPDAVEAQPTGGYENPTLVVNRGGVMTTVQDGLYTPVDTDGDGIADYIDTDADNDGTLDSAEVGAIPTPTFNNVDSGLNTGAGGLTNSGGSAEPNVREVPAVTTGVSGNSGNDTLSGTAGADVVRGGRGDDALNGGAGSDVYLWLAGDQGTSGVAANDTIAGFTATSGGDVINIDGLLVGENTTGGLGNLLHYININISAGNTDIRLSTTGGFANGLYSAGANDQTITLSGVNLSTTLAVNNNNALLLEALLNSGGLIA